MSASEIERTLVRLAHEIVEKSNGSEDLALVGIKRRGVPLAERLGRLISTIEKRPVRYGCARHSVLSRRPVHSGHSAGGHAGSCSFDVEGRDIVICDDVLYTGRTIRPRSTRSSTMAGRGAFNWPYSLTAATASCPSKLPTWQACSHQ